jgi:hypothetical protein
LSLSFSNFQYRERNKNKNKNEKEKEKEKETFLCPFPSLHGLPDEKSKHPILIFNQYE